METSQEYIFGLKLIRRFEKELEAVAGAGDPAEMKRLIEPIRHPITGAMAQIKEGKGPHREELLRVLAVVVSEFRELENPQALKEAIGELLSLVREEAPAVEGK